MVYRSSPPTVAAVVAAHNEEERLGHVLQTLAGYPGFDEVIVVDDGSTDATADIAHHYGVTCLRLETNQGKGAALEAGVRHAGTDVLFFADADIRNLDHNMISTLIAPVAGGEVDMFVAMRHRSLYHLRSVLTVVPLLGGERAVSSKLWHSVPERYRHRFKIEAALNFYAVHYGRGLRYRVFPIAQTTKEKKYGLVRGLTQRGRMLGNVAAAMVEVQSGAAPPKARARRRAALVAVAATAGLLGSAYRLSRHGGTPGVTTAVGGAVGNAVGSAAGDVGCRGVARRTAALTTVASALTLLAQLPLLAQSQARDDG